MYALQTVRFNSILTDAFLNPVSSHVADFFTPGTVRRSSNAISSNCTSFTHATGIQLHIH